MFCSFVKICVVTCHTLWVFRWNFIDKYLNERAIINALTGGDSFISARYHYDWEKFPLDYYNVVANHITHLQMIIHTNRPFKLQASFCDCVKYHHRTWKRMWYGLSSEIVHYIHMCETILEMNLFIGCAFSFTPSPIYKFKSVLCITRLQRYWLSPYQLWAQSAINYLWNYFRERALCVCADYCCCFHGAYQLRSKMYKWIYNFIILLVHSTFLSDVIMMYFSRSFHIHVVFSKKKCTQIVALNH